MKQLLALPKAYRDLAADRASFAPCDYGQPEDFGYDFYDWVSPYTKGANRYGGVAVVLQDWASADGLPRQPDPEIQELGRKQTLRTNVVLEKLLCRVLGLSLSDVYATNAFPFVKPGGMSSPVPQWLVNCAASYFLRQELELAAPEFVLALGGVAFRSLQAVPCTSFHCIKLPHPAARIGDLGAHEARWRGAIPVHVQVSRPRPR